LGNYKRLIHLYLNIDSDENNTLNNSSNTTQKPESSALSQDADPCLPVCRTFNLGLSIVKTTGNETQLRAHPVLSKVVK